jgi:hypothetical protein
MIAFVKRALSAAAILVMAAACGHGAGAPAEAPGPGGEGADIGPATPTEPEAEPEGAYDARVLAVAAEYQSWGRVDDQMHAAPTACKAPSHGPVARMSQSDDGGTHGQKLYSVFAKARAQYASDHAPVGQVIVKESWKPELVADPASVPSPYASADFHPYATIDGKTFKAGDPAGLFIMMKVAAEATPGTDAGWIYGTVAPDGALTSAGMIDACKGCHESAPHDRLFGLSL